MDNLLVPISELESAFDDICDVSVLKNGGQKNVLSAIHREFGNVVLKIFSPDMGRGRVERELQTLELQLNYVPRVFYSGEKNFSTGKFFISIEQRIDGTDVSSFARQNRITYGLAVRLIRDILNILVQLENNGLVHRDIKPDNIIIDRKGRFWLIDFGAVRDLNAKTLTQTGYGAPMTYGYAAPEQYDPAMRDMIDSRTDLFSLGVTIYSLLNGKNPFLDGCHNAYEIAQTTRQCTLPTLNIEGDHNQGLAKYIKLLMSKDMAARPPSVKVAIEWLRRFVQNGGGLI